VARPVARVAHGRQLAPLRAFDYRRLASFHHMLRSAHGCSWVHRHDLADDQRIKQHPHGRKLLLHTRSRVQFAIHAATLKGRIALSVAPLSHTGGRSTQGRP
jgi:hypothetical protein